MDTVLIIDDHDIVRFGVETLFAGLPDLHVAGTAGTVADGLRLIGERRPSVVISDLSMDDSSGLDTVRAVVEAQNPRPTLILSMHDELVYGEQVLALGARGYIPKTHAHSSVVPACRAVLRGETWVSPRLNSRMLNRLLQRNRPGGRTQQDPGALSLRELQVLELLRTGRTTKEIAFALDLSPRTVDIHRANIKKKLGLRTGAELIAYALRKT